MADGHFPTLVSKDRNDNAAANVIYVQLSDGSAVLDTTSGALDVNVDNTVTVSGTVAISGTVTVDCNSSDVTVDNAGGAAAVNIQDGGNSITIDGTLTGITNDVNIADGGNSITVDGTVAATQSGVWDIGTVTTLTGITNDVNIADGGNSITVDASDLDIRNIVHTQDSIALGDGTGVLVDVLDSTIDALQVAISDGTDQLSVNTDGSINVNIVSSVIAGEVHDYDTQAALASDTADNHDYSVANSTMLLKSVIFSCSGGGKFEVQTGPVASLATIAVGFVPKHGGTEQIFFDPAREVPVASTGTVRVIRTNRQGTAQDVYSTIIGQDI